MSSHPNTGDVSAHYSGQCHCGKLSFTATSDPVVHLSCHCQDCRSATGSDFSSIAFFKSATFQQGGDVVTKTFVSDLANQTVRESCEVCGTVMFDKSAGFRNLIGVFSNEIKRPVMPSPRIHVWISSKLSDVKIPLKVKSFEKGLS